MRNFRFGGKILPIFESGSKLLVIINSGENVAESHGQPALKIANINKDLVNGKYNMNVQDFKLDDDGNFYLSGNLQSGKKVIMGGKAIAQEMPKVSMYR